MQVVAVALLRGGIPLGLVIVALGAYTLLCWGVLRCGSYRIVGGVSLSCGGIFCRWFRVVEIGRAHV